MSEIVVNEEKLKLIIQSHITDNRQLIEQTGNIGYTSWEIAGAIVAEILEEKAKRKRPKSDHHNPTPTGGVLNKSLKKVLTTVKL
jgi:hypothetical protein